MGITSFALGLTAYKYTPPLRIFVVLNDLLSTVHSPARQLFAIRAVDMIRSVLITMVT